MMVGEGYTGIKVVRVILTRIFRCLYWVPGMGVNLSSHGHAAH